MFSNVAISLVEMFCPLQGKKGEMQELIKARNYAPRIDYECFVTRRKI